MKQCRSPLPCLASVAFISLSLSCVALAVREVIPLKADWSFIKEDVALIEPSAAWEKISVPHTWNALDGQTGPAQISDQQEMLPVIDEATKREDAAKRAAANLSNKKGISGTVPEGKDPRTQNGYYRGVCWYEHQLEIPAEWKGKKRVFVRFEAAGTVAKIYINKTMIGEHRGGFTAFCYEVTDRLRYGGANELRVQVNNSYRDDLPPLSGDFNLYGGLYRPVQMIVTDKVCISPLDYASSGVYLTTKSLDPKEASVEVRSIVSNGNKSGDFSKQADKTPGAAGTEDPAQNEDKENGSTPVMIETEIKDGEGKVVAKATTENLVPYETSVPVTQNLTISDPHQWNGRKDPYLYTATVSLHCNGKIIDQVSQQLGLRSASITREEGFLLNGNPYPVHGVCRHQDVRNKGWAVSSEDEQRDASIMKEMGVTAVRNAHYPQSENWHQINDREGVLLWDEVSLVNETRATRDFWHNSEEYLREMVHQLYNHPSVVWWGIFNELGNRPMPPSDPELAHLQDVVKEIDPSRMVVAASCRPGRSFNQIAEQMAFNHYPAWYHPSPPSEMKTYIQQRFDEMGRRIAISEYGAGANISHHLEGVIKQPDPRGPFHPEEYQAFCHEGEWAVMKDNPQLWGSFVWNMFDFAAKSRKEGNTPSLNDKGLVTHDRQFKKDAFYFYKANWNPEPMVYITSRRAVNRTLPTTEVKVYSNCPEVELTVNGKSLGTTKPGPTKIALWPKVELSPGENKLEVTAVSETPGTKPVHDSCTWNLIVTPKP